MPKYLASGRRSLNGFAEEAGFIAVEWPSDPVDPFFNINSVSDLKTAEELLAG
jgi:molybdopterin-guanine dinucleotide biosynthesis protein A